MTTLFCSSCTVKHDKIGNSKVSLKPSHSQLLVEQPSELSLTRQLLLKPGSSEPISGMGVILPWSTANVNHLLHLCANILLHLQSHHQRLINTGPVVSFFPWFDWLGTKEVVVLGSSHSEVVNELDFVASLLISMFPK